MSNYWLDQDKAPQGGTEMSDPATDAFLAKVLEISEIIHQSSEKRNSGDVKDDEWHVPYEDLSQLRQQGFLTANEVAEYAVKPIHMNVEYSVADAITYSMIPSPIFASPVFTLNKVPADINFYTHGEERLRIAEDGGFYVNGKLVTTDIEVYEGMKKWLVSVGMIGA